MISKGLILSSFVKPGSSEAKFVGSLANYLSLIYLYK